jgi:hypothetical protein
MKLYKVVSNHDIYEDSYTEGELGYCHTYDEDAQIKAETPKEAVEKYFSEVLRIDPNELGIDYDGDRVYSSKLVDSDGALASSTEIEMWKKGELKLYSENITVRVYAMELITF